MSKQATILDAVREPEILVALCAAIRADAEVPTTADLAVWLVRDAPPEFAEEANARLAAVLGTGAEWVVARTVEFAFGSGGRSHGDLELRATGGLSPADVHAVWRTAPDRVRHPLGPLVRGWLERPRPGTALNLRPDPILPSGLAMAGPRCGEGPGSARLALFSAPRHSSGDVWLPGFGEPDTTGPCLPLALYDLMDAGHRGGGRGADMALRMFVEAVLGLSEVDRGVSVDHPVILPGVTLRRFLDWFYEGTGRRPQPSEYYPRLEAAAEALASNRARIEWVDPLTGKGGRRTVVRVEDLPRGPGKLDDEVSVSVFLPPTAGVGSAVNRSRLRYWGRRSEPAYRALLGLTFRWFRPGVTRFPLRRGGRVVTHLQSSDPDQYDELSPGQLIELCYPKARGGSRRYLLARALKTIAVLNRTGDLSRPDPIRRPGLILPPVRRGDRE